MNYTTDNNPFENAGNATGNTSNNTGASQDSHLKRFWKLLIFKRLPECPEDINALVQTEMMKHYSRAPICKLTPRQVEKYLTRLFVSDTRYFCSRSKLLITSPEIRQVIDMILEQDLQWHIEVNLDSVAFVFASWHHWTV